MNVEQLIIQDIKAIKMRKILAIDDQMDNLITMKAVIKAYLPDYHVLVAQSGADGIELAQSEQPEVILLDIIMPGMDGYQVCQKLKFDPETSHIPVIMVTAIKTDSASRVRGLEMGADAFISKPIDAPELVAQLKVMLRIRKTEEKLKEEKASIEQVVEIRTAQIRKTNERLKKEIEDRRQAEKKLIDSDVEHVLILQAALDGFWMLDTQGKFLEVNAAYCRMSGYSEQELLKMSIPDLEADENKEQAEFHLKNVIKTGGDLFETRHRRKDGSIFHVEVRTQYHPFKGGVLVAFIKDITSRKLVEAELLKLRAAVDTSGEVIFMTDREGVFIFINPAFTALYGHTADEVIDKSTPRILKSRKMSKRDYEIFWDNLQKGNTVKGELINKTKDGRMLTIDSSVNPILNNQNEIIGFLAIQRDVTDRKQALEELLQSEQKFRDIFNHSADAAFIFDKSGNILEVNDVARERYGYGYEDFLKLNISDLVSPEATGTVNKRYKIKNQVQVFEEVHKRKDGSTFPVEVHAAKIQYDGQPSLLTHAHDITNRKLAGEVLRESEERFRMMFDQAPLAYQSLDFNGQFIDVNQAWLEAFGYSRGEVIGRNISEFLTPGYKAVFEEQFPLFKEVGETHGEFKMVHKDGSILIMAVEGRIGYDLDGNFKQTHCLLQNITEQARAAEEKAKLEAQLQQSQKMESIGRLAGGVAHDYNNMLSVIIGHAEMAIERLDQKEAVKADLEGILKASHRSAEITRQLLAFARKQTIRPQTLDLNETVESMLKMIQRLLGEDIDLAWLPGRNLWPIKMDPSQVDQVLANLCVNARDAITGVGKISIGTNKITVDDMFAAKHPGATPGDYLILSVSDNGIGMDSATIDRIFEPFFTTKPTGKGTGLGLATVYGIIKQNEGFIDVYSELGAGTTFKIYLPRQLGGATTSKTIDRTEIPNGNGETILLVEDEAAVREMGTHILTNLGYKVQSFLSPLEALKMVGESSCEISLLVTDVVMPEMNGRDLAAQCRELCQDVKVLYMSGYTADVIAHRGVLDDGVNFIQKPFTIRELAVKVRKVLDSK